MRKIIYITIFVLISFSCHAQKLIENRQSGAVVRATINNNFDTVYTNYLDAVINVLDFGAVADGSTDNATAFQEALDSAASQGKALFIPEGHYRIDSELSNTSFTRTKPCIIRGEGYVKLDFSNVASSGSVFTLSSDGDDSKTDLDYDLNKGDTLLVSSLASSVSRGDVLQIVSDSIWARTAGIYRREMVKVRRTSNDTIFLYTPIYDDYESDGSYVKDLNSAVLQIENLELIGNTNQYQNAFTFDSFRDVNINNITIQDFDNIGFSCTRLFGGIIQNCTATEQLRDGFGYGIHLQICQNINISGCHIYGARHAVAMGLTTRSIIVRGCSVYAGKDYDYPLECHESCEYLTWEDNFLYGGGFYIRGLNCSLNNNRIFMTKNGGAAIGLVMYGYTGRINKYVHITDNKVIPLGGAGHYAIQAKFWHNSDTIENIIITNNQFNANTHGIYFHTNDNALDTANHVGRLLFSDNILEQTNTGKSSIYLTDSITFDIVQIIGGQYITEGNGIAINPGSGSGNLYLNDLYLYTGNASAAAIANNRFTNFIVKDCHLKGGYIKSTVSGHFILQDNTIEDAGDYGGVWVNGADVFTYDGNSFINCTGIITDNATTTNTGTNW